jgi:hypothetical protein
MNLPDNLKKRFCKDFKIPINIYEEPYFTYFKELYEPTFKINEKLNWLEEVIKATTNIDDVFLLSEKISKNIKQVILNSKAYNDFNSVDVNKEFPLEEQVQNRSIYVEPNIGKTLISIDLEKANFNSFGLFNLKEELMVETYDDLMRKETHFNYYLNSKVIRQVIFGDLNPNRQHRIQKYIINQICMKLKKEGCILTSANSDEIIVENNISINEINEILKDVDNRFKFFRVELFKFERVVDGYDFFIKETITKTNKKIEFKNVPSHFFAQVYKQHFGLDLTAYDMLFYHDGFLAEFKEPLMLKKKKIKEVKNECKGINSIIG